mgnify:CR=1 FL=1
MRILGIDPGLRITGYGVVDIIESQQIYVASGVIETTRGDRLFISLLGSGFICLIWLFAFGPPLWGALICCLIYAAAVFRWV